MAAWKDHDRPPIMPPTPSRVPTLREIAKASGMSLTTVSCALRGQPGVAEKSVQHVRRVAEEMGWKPNPLVSAWLSHVRSTHAPMVQATLAYIISHPQGIDGHFSSEVYRAYCEGARKRAQELGFSLELYHYEEFGEQRLAQILEARGTPALVVAPLPEFCHEISLPWDGFTSATIAYSLVKPPIHRAANHHFHSVATAVKTLRAYGYGRIGLAVPQDVDERSFGMFTGGYWSSSHYAGLSALNLFSDFYQKESFPAFGRWLKEERPDVVIGLEMVAEWIRGHGYALPGEIAFANLDRRAEHGDHAGIDQRAERIGATAVDLVTAQLFRNERGLPEHPKLSIVQGAWVDGATAPRKKKDKGL